MIFLRSVPELLIFNEFREVSPHFVKFVESAMFNYSPIVHNKDFMGILYCG